MIYYEEKNVFGQWTPRTSAERPDAKSVNGQKREIRNVNEVPPLFAGADLQFLMEHFAQSVPPVAESPLGEHEEHLIELALAFDADVVEDEDEAVYVFNQGDLLKMLKTLTDPALFITDLANNVHKNNVDAGWWTDLKTGEDLHGKRNVGEMLCLIHSEISEAMEGHRKRLMDDKLPHRPMLKVELIDAMIRILDLLGSEGNDEHPAGVIFQEKREYNGKRADHKPEARLAAGGKAF